MGDRRNLGVPKLAADEPNNSSTEFYLNYFCSECILDGVSISLCLSTWNNLPDILGWRGNTDVRAYIIEWDSYPVPVPPAIWLFVSGLLGIFVTGRKARRC